MSMIRTAIMILITAGSCLLRAGEGLPGEFAGVDAVCLEAARTLQNPACAGLTEQAGFIFTNTFLPAATHLSFAGLRLPVGRRHSLAVTGIMFYSGGIAVRDETGLLSGASFGDRQTALALSYAFRAGRLFTGGLNIKSVSHHLAVSDGNGGVVPEGTYAMMLDAGMLFQPLLPVRFGLSAVNAAQYQLTPSSSLSRDWPLAIRFTVGYRGKNDRLRLDLHTDFADAATDMRTRTLRSVSLQYGMSWQVRPWFALRSGVNDREFGFGMEYRRDDIGGALHGMALDYYAGYFYRYNEVVNRVGISYAWGGTRAQREERRLSRIQQMAPLNEFAEAVRLYGRGMFWDAAYAFGRVTALYPDFEKSDEALFYIGESFTRLKMHGMAGAFYRQLQEMFPHSERLPEAFVRLMHGAYRQGEYDKAAGYFDALENMDTGGRGSSEAAYLMGQIAFKRAAYADARNFLCRVEKGTPFYPYAQFTRAQVELYLGNIDRAGVHLDSVLISDADTPEEKALHDRARLVRGHVFYEMYDYGKAAAEYEEIGSRSPYYTQARLALAWGLVNSQEYEKAVHALQPLLKKEHPDIWSYEGRLVGGYCLTLLKQYEQARTLLEELRDSGQNELWSLDIDPGQEMRLLSDTELEIRHAVMRLNELAGTITSGVTCAQPEKGNTEKDRCYGEYRQRLTGWRLARDAYFAMKHTLSRARQLRKMMQDTEYALATALHLQEIDDKRKVDHEYNRKIHTLEEKLREQLRGSGGK